MHHSEGSFEQRANDLFDRSVVLIEEDMGGLLSRQSAAGRLQSGMTAILAVEVVEKRTQEALDTAMAEVARQIEHRRSKWSSAMGEVKRSLDRQLSRGMQLAESALGPALGSSGSAKQAAQGRWDEAEKRLRERWREFRDGWTSPVAKSWKDRHAAAYAVLLIVAGAIVGKVLDLIVKASS